LNFFYYCFNDLFKSFTFNKVYKQLILYATREIAIVDAIVDSRL